MEVQFTQDLQARLDRLAADSGRSQKELLEDALAVYLEELADTRSMLDRRYDELKSGRVVPVSGDEVRERIRARSAARLVEHQ